MTKTRCKRKATPKPVYSLRAEIQAAWPTYYVVDEPERRLEETFVRLRCVIVETSAMLEQHRGEEIEIRLACERFLPDVSQSAQRAQLSLILRKNLRSMVAYLPPDAIRSEEHTSELQSLMRISYAVFCLKKKRCNYKI